MIFLCGFLRSFGVWQKDFLYRPRIIGKYIVYTKKIKKKWLFPDTLLLIIRNEVSHMTSIYLQDMHGLIMHEKMAEHASYRKMMQWIAKRWGNNSVGF